MEQPTERGGFAALLHSTRDGRDSLVDAACSDDPWLAAQVRRLLKAHDSLAGREPAPEPSPDLNQAGDQIGPYRLLERLGEGGMGTVFVAEQTEPVRRQVALKLIKPGLDSRDVIARFESERQALALMSHPNIARILDAGTSGDGRPYFVMEYVPGCSIVEYCDRNQLSIRERISLFLEVCHAVQHAHQRGIIHRDLKPSNILVAEDNGRPLPKVIDFGIAKATDQEWVHLSVQTAIGALVGTPEYMSPEQIEGGEVDIDTRADVYALGVVLYELLAGCRPFVVPNGPHGVASVLCSIIEDDPPRPSTRLAKLGVGTEVIARDRRTDLSNLLAELRGDLDWIVLKAMAKRRSDRYLGAGVLVEELDRYLRAEPVSARPPGGGYHLRKFIRRNRIAAGFMGVILVLIVGFGATAAHQAARLARERDLANQETQAAERVSQFLIDLFEVENAAHRSGPALDAKGILDRGSRRIRQELSGEPEVEGRLLATMAQAYMNLGLADTAQAMVEEALRLQRDGLGLWHPDLARSLYALAVIHMQAGRLDSAEQSLTEALAIRRRVLDPIDPLMDQTMSLLAAMVYHDGDYPRAEALYLEAMKIQKRRTGSASANLLVQYGNLLNHKGDLEAAEASYREALNRRIAQFGPQHLQVANSYHRLALLYQKMRRWDAARATFHTTLALQRDILGGAHPQIGHTTANLARLHLAAGRCAEAIPLFVQATEILTTQYGPEHWATAVLRVDHGRCLARMGDALGAERELTHGYRTLEDALGPDHFRTRDARDHLTALAAVEDERRS